MCAAARNKNVKDKNHIQEVNNNNFRLLFEKYIKFICMYQ